MTSNLSRRVAFAAVAIPAVLVVAWIGGWVFAVLIGVAGAIGAREVYTFARAQGIEPLERTGMVSAGLVPLVVVSTLVGSREAAPAMLTERLGGGTIFLVWFLAMLTIALVRRAPGQRPLASVSVTVVAVLYAGWLPSFALYLRHQLPHAALDDRTVGMALLVYPLALTWIGDTVAMAAGKAFGGRRLAPVISPNKTWAGAFGSIFGTMAISLIFAALVFRRVGVAMSVAEALVIGLCISLAAQVGDLAESLMKREVGLKDSSSLIPGHGGLLDRLDSLYFVLPVTALLYRVAGLT